MKKTAVRKGFGTRLGEALTDAGFIRQRGAMVGPDHYAVKDHLKVSREVARRYLAGETLPDPEKMADLAKWLHVNVAWLRDGTGPKQLGGVDETVRDEDERRLLAYYRLAKPDGKRFILDAARVTVLGNSKE